MTTATRTTAGASRAACPATGATKATATRPITRATMTTCPATRPTSDVAMRAAQKLQGEFPDLSIEKVDMLEHPEVCEQHRIYSAPGIVINGKLEFVGAVNEGRLREKLRQISSP